MTNQSGSTVSESEDELDNLEMELTEGRSRRVFSLMFKMLLLKKLMKSLAFQVKGMMGSMDHWRCRPGSCAEEKPSTVLIFPSSSMLLWRCTQLPYVFPD